jgi:hypothetical protein
MMINDQQLKTCTICKQSYEHKTNNDLIKHFKQNHCSVNGESYKCNICTSSNTAIHTSNSTATFTQFEYDLHVLKGHNVNQKPVTANGMMDREQAVSQKKTSQQNNTHQAPYTFTSVPFSADLTAVLNDPRKDRVKTSNLFTKTWGSDFIEEPSFPEFATRKFPIITSSDFRPYFNQVSAVRIRTDRLKLVKFSFQST